MYFIFLIWKKLGYSVALLKVSKVDLFLFKQAAANEWFH